MNNLQTVAKPLAMPRDSLPPNLYSGAYLLGQHFMLGRENFMPVAMTNTNRVKVYTWRGKFYTVPQVNASPEPGYNWEHIGRKRSRDLYEATRRRVS